MSTPRYFQGWSPDAHIPSTGTLSRGQIEGLWEHVGGDPSKASLMSYVAMAESAGRIRAESLTNDYGLWQINSVHFGEYGLDADNVMWPNANAFMAKVISSNGSNIGPWCTSWADPNRDCGSGWLGTPQAGSRTGRLMGAGPSSPPPPPGGPGGTGTGSGQTGTSGGSPPKLPLPPDTAPPGPGLDSVQASWDGIGDILGTYNGQIMRSLWHWKNQGDIVIAEI